MAFSKGHKKVGGRPPGGVNKATRTAREAFQLAFEGMGGTEALIVWAKANKTEFLKLYARLIPVEHVGDGGEGPVNTVVKHIFETVAIMAPGTKP